MGKGLFNRVQGELNAREKTAGLSMSDVLTLPDPLSSLVNWMIRKGDAELPEIVNFLKQDSAKVEGLLNDLIDKGFARKIEVNDRVLYRIRLAPKRGKEIPLDLWQAIDGKIDKK